MRRILLHVDDSQRGGTRRRADDAVNAIDHPDNDHHGQAEGAQEDGAQEGGRPRDDDVAYRDDAAAPAAHDDDDAHGNNSGQPTANHDHAHRDDTASPTDDHPAHDDHARHPTTSVELHPAGRWRRRRHRQSRGAQ
jgi:hypothetical protein